MRATSFARGFKYRTPHCKHCQLMRRTAFGLLPLFLACAPPNPGQPPAPATVLPAGEAVAPAPIVPAGQPVPAATILPAGRTVPPAQMLPAGQVVPPARILPAGQPQFPEGTRFLRIIATNDFHGALEPRPDANGVRRGGAAYVPAAIGRARSECA